MKKYKSFSAEDAEKRANRVAWLIAGFIQDRLSPIEHRELDDWVTASTENQLLFEELTDPAVTENWLQGSNQQDKKTSLKKLTDLIGFPAFEQRQVEQRPMAGRRRNYAMAAATLVVLIIGALFWSRRQPGHQNNDTVRSDHPNVHDLFPGKKRATITFGDGTTQRLDSLGSGILTSQGGTFVIKDDSDRLIYQPGSPVATAEPVINILRVPRGGEYELWLPDGTHLKLNADSWVKYPSAFTGKDRQIELGGEGFFDVAASADKPFVVHTGKTDITVLGTQFDVNAYTDQDGTTVTLARGELKIQNTVLRPGEQARIGPLGEMKVLNTDLQPALAWTRGEFLFRDAPLDVIMQQLSRWYNVSIEFQGGITQHFNASVPRSEPVSKILHFLEETRHVRFEIAPDKIIVRPY
jgi:transmembrane sensor